MKQLFHTDFGDGYNNKSLEIYAENVQEAWVIAEESYGRGKIRSMKTEDSGEIELYVKNKAGVIIPAKRQNKWPFKIMGVEK